MGDLLTPRVTLPWSGIWSVTFDGLCSADLMLLASLVSNREEIHYRVSSEGEMVRYLSMAFSTDNTIVKVEAVRCRSDGRGMFRVRGGTMYTVG